MLWCVKIIFFGAVQGSNAPKSLKRRGASLKQYALGNDTGILVQHESKGSLLELKSILDDLSKDLSKKTGRKRLEAKVQTICGYPGKERLVCFVQIYDEKYCEQRAERWHCTIQNPFFQHHHIFWNSTPRTVKQNECRRYRDRRHKVETSTTSCCCWLFLRMQNRKIGHSPITNEFCEPLLKDTR